MKVTLKTEITKIIGILDAPGLIAQLENIGVEDDVQLTREYISIPSSLVKDLASFQKSLKGISENGRDFTISVVNDRIHIDLCARHYNPGKQKDSIFFEDFLLQSPAFDKLHEKKIKLDSKNTNITKQSTNGTSAIYSLQLSQVLTALAESKKEIGTVRTEPKKTALTFSLPENLLEVQNAVSEDSEVDSQEDTSASANVTMHMQEKTTPEHDSFDSVIIFAGPGRLCL